jgi:hypothetical protein
MNRLETLKKERDQMVHQMNIAHNILINTLVITQSIADIMLKASLEHLDKLYEANIQATGVKLKNKDITIGALGKKDVFNSGLTYHILSEATVGTTKFKLGDEVVFFDEDSTTHYKGKLTWMCVTAWGDVECVMSDILGRVDLTDLTLTPNPHLTQDEKDELAHLRKLQAITTRFFNLDEFNRLNELTTKLMRSIGRYDNPNG